MPASLVPLYRDADGGNDHNTVLEQTHSARNGSRLRGFKGRRHLGQWGDKKGPELCSIYAQLAWSHQQNQRPVPDDAEVPGAS